MTDMGRTAVEIIKRVFPLMAVMLVVSCINIEHWGPRARRERAFELSASMPAGSTLGANTRSGSISVQGTDGDECHVTAKIQVRAATKEKAEELAEAIQVRLERSAAGLEVVTDVPRSVDVADYSVSLDLAVPHGTILKVTTGDGPIRVKHVDGSVEARTANGDVEMENVKGDVHAKSYDGAVTCTQIEGGAVELYSSDGKIRLVQAKVTSCKAETSDGLVYLADVQAESLDLHTKDGGIRCQNVAAKKLNCSSSEGSVYITWAPDAPKSPDITVALTDGSITFVGITDISAVLDAFTNSGPIRAQIPGIARGRLDKSLQATLGEGGGRLVFTTHDGSITIR